MASLDVARLRAEFSGPHELVQASDGRVLFVRRWAAVGQPRASVLFFHGITGYSGPYGRMFAERLAAGGYSVYGMDLRGHGLSDGKRGDYPSGERLARDLAETVAFVKARSKRVVVLGHSLGALSAMIAVKSCPEGIDGLVLLSAARRTRQGIYRRPSARGLAKTLLGVAVLRGSPLIEYRRDGMSGTDDPLFNFRYSARFYTAFYGVGALAVSRMLRTGVLDSPNLRFSGSLTVPLLVGVGDQDEIFPAEAAKEFFDGIPSDDKEFLVIPGARHAVFPQEAGGLLAAWLDRKYPDSGR